MEYLLRRLHQQHLFRNHRAGPGAGTGNLSGINTHALQRQHIPQADVRQIQQLFTGAHLLCQQKAIQDIPLNQRVYMVIIPLVQVLVFTFILWKSLGRSMETRQNDFPVFHQAVMTWRPRCLPRAQT